MTKKELISAVADKAGFTKKDTEVVINGVFEAIGEQLLKGEEVTIAGFGKFSVAERAAREGINPRTGEKVQIAAKKSMKFKAMGDFKSL